MEEKPKRFKLIFDTCALITASKFKVDCKLIIDYFLEFTEIHIPKEVCIESTNDFNKYEDAREIKRRIDDKKIIVHELKYEKTVLKDLDRYNIGLGEKMVILLYRKKHVFDYAVIDDFLACIIGKRFRIKYLLFLDLIVLCVKKKLLIKDQACKIVQSVQSRYDKGFISHTFSMIERSKI